MSPDRTTRLVQQSCLFLFLILQVWLTHALAYLVHEYAHSFLAWALHCKANPLALDYGHLDWNNILYLDDIDENVDYAPILNAGRAPTAALIAIAGVLFGNGLLYLFSRRLYSAAKARRRPLLAFFLFLLCMMNVGNFLSYVPNRTFTTHADMATAEQSLHLSPWWIATLLGVPFALALWHFFATLLPGARRFFFPASNLGQISLVLLCAWVVFRFFGSSGLHRYGPVSHALAFTCMDVLFPLSILLCWPRHLQHAASQRAIA